MRGQRPTSPLSNLIRIGAAGFLVGVAFLVWSIFSPRVEPTRPQPKVAAAAARVPANERSANERSAKKPMGLLAGTIGQIESSVVRIEAATENRTSQIGSGFVIDARGLVATSFHVLAEAKQATVLFRDGATYEVDGYVAVQPDSDLAIVALKAPPSSLTPLVLSEAGDPAALSPVVAIGHPHGIDFSPYDGRISRILNTSQLPPRSRRFVLEGFPSETDQRWIQHTAALAEGNSGGPLLDEQGQVIGVNTWVDKEARFGYAIHVQHLRELKSTVTDQKVPLTALHKKDPAPDRIDSLQAKDLEDLFDQAKAFRFRPLSADDYVVLQQLAWAVTVVQLPQSLEHSRTDRDLTELTRAADRIVKRLERETWDDLGQMTIVNEYALPRLNEPRAGGFFFATVDRVVEGPDGSRGALMRLAGETQMLFMPLDDQLVLPTAGTQCLVLGVNYHGQVVRYGENPLNLTSATVIATRTILPLGR